MCHHQGMLNRQPGWVIAVDMKRWWIITTNMSSQPKGTINSNMKNLTSLLTQFWKQILPSFSQPAYITGLVYSGGICSLSYVLWDWGTKLFRISEPQVPCPTAWLQREVRTLLCICTSGTIVSASSFLSQVQELFQGLANYGSQPNSYCFLFSK